MSASERLRALDGALGPASNCDWGWDDDEIGPLRNALPLIADVVEAAEAMKGFADTADYEEGCDLIAERLTALSEHLKGQ